MIWVVGVHTAQEANVVYELREMRQQFADLQTRFTLLLIGKGYRHQTARRVFGTQLHLSRTLTGELVDGRFVIEEVWRKRAAIHEQVDDAFRACSKMCRVFG